ncbi:MAG TPA: NUDIX domain-containing protein [Patescibacteria group bacterium]|nr:NUDIX domain-containing protein [Patescibacteria group bacterium]
MAEYSKEIRKKVGTGKILIPGTACILLNERDEILLQLRSSNRKWGCPGGLMDIGETVIESLKREVFEETNLTIENPVLLGIYSGTTFEGKYPDGNEIASVLMAFIVREFSGELRCDEESLEMKFFNVRELSRNLHPHHGPYLHDFKKWLLKEIDIPVVF